MSILWDLFWLLRQALNEGVSHDDLREAIKREMTRAADERMRQKFGQ